ncbi:MAG TPA: ABC transporter ATP-binding protein [Anaerolineae bacterium]|nr:ABC transporter ATP-binding protein [Anaerolineae bacterium]
MNEQPAIQLNNLGKTFGRRKRKVEAVRGIDLAVPAGLVYGFLGPNGAGKSTTIRMIMDLIRPSGGEALVYGRNVQKDHAILQRVGTLVEGAAFYNFLSGRRNLELLARTGDAYDAGRIQTLLEQVGLADKADRQVKGYSTGMKQRLGLAAALLNDPDLVILDEPTNGLDPAGIQEMRGFIRDLADKQGKTVFLSSHLLGKVEQVCDRVAIINQGKIVSEGRVADLLAGQSSLLLDVGEVDRATAVLQSRWPVAADGQWLAVTANRTETPELVQMLVAQNVAIYEIRHQQQSLEQFFLDVTGEKK